MAWHSHFWNWLLQAAAGEFMILAVGSLAALACRQPVRRAQLVFFTMLGALIGPGLSLLSIAPQWSPSMLAAKFPSRAESPKAVLGPKEAEAGLPSYPTPINPSIVKDTLSIGRNARNLIKKSYHNTTTIPWSLLVVAGYLVVAAVMCLWWLLGQAMLLRLKQKADAAPLRVLHRFFNVSGIRSARVQLLVSDQIALPFTFTWFRPVILLPSTLCDSSDEALDYILAHEWSHIERRDAWTWNLAVCAGFLLFHQPLFWWLRRQLRLCQDYLADDRAAAYGSPENYADYLVRLARRNRVFSPALLPALGIGDRRSNLWRRIVMLVKDREPLERRCRLGWSLAVVALTAAVIVVASGLRLEAQDASSATQPKESAKPPETSSATSAKSEGAIVYNCRLTDKATGKPIAGADVRVEISLLPDPKTGEQRILEESRQTTDAQGGYHVTIRPEQAAQRSLYVVLEAQHPGHVRYFAGYSFGMIQKNEKLGGRPFFENLQLRPGEPIEGRLLTSEGSPAADVKVMVFAAPPRPAKGPREFGSFSETWTDAQGRFRLDVTTPATVVYWLLPQHHISSTHILKNDKRGDLGTFTLVKGIHFRGKVLDAQGKPVANAYIGAERERDAGDDDTLDQLSVADQIRRTTLTQADGTFVIGPFPPGVYSVIPEEESWDPPTRRGAENSKRRPLSSVFLSQKITLKEGETPDPLEIRAVPHVVVEAQIYDSQGKPRSGHEQFLNGRIDGDFWSTRTRPTSEGKYVILAPHGLEDATMSKSTNEHTVLRHRVSKDQPLSNKNQIELGTLDHDIKDLEIRRYVSPILVVKVATKDGTKPLHASVSLRYTVREKDQPQRILAEGVRSDCGFEEQEDGRFRSESVFPDEEVRLTATAEGFAPKSATFTLPEGTTKDVELILEKP